MFRKLAVLGSVPDPMTGMKKAMKYEAEVLKTNKIHQMKQSDLIQVTFLLNVDFMKAIPFFGNFRVCYRNTIHTNEHVIYFSLCTI